MASLNDLPDEVLLVVLSCLQSAPPSQTEILRLPVADVFRKELCPLKCLSRVSRRWRRLTLGLLMKHLVLNLDALDFNNLEHSVEEWCSSVKPFRPSTLLVTAEKPLTASDMDATSLWNTIDRIWKYSLSQLNPSRIVILAPYANLFVLLGGKAEADSEYRHFHILELDRKQSSDEYIHSAHTSTDYGLASRSHGLNSNMLNASSWAHIGLNEGSHGSFHFPTSAPNRPYLLQRLFPSCCHQNDTRHSHRWQHMRDEMSFLDSFTYVAYSTWKYSDYFPLPLVETRGVHSFQFLRELRLKLLPDISSTPPDLYDLPPDEQAVYWYENLRDTMDMYRRLRLDMIAQHANPLWRLRKVISYDDRAIQQYPLYMREFEKLLTKDLPAFDGQPEVRWGRIWEMSPSDREGGPRFVVHA